MSHTLGQHVRAIRKSKGLKLKDLAEKSGLSIPYLSDTERDVVNPSVKTLQSIAKALELSLPEIVDFNDELEHRLLWKIGSCSDPIRYPKPYSRSIIAHKKDFLHQRTLLTFSYIVSAESSAFK